MTKNVAVELQIVNLQKDKTLNCQVAKHGIFTRELCFRYSDVNFRETVSAVCRPSILKEIKSVVSSLNPTSDVISYIDDDSDKIVLDDADSYVEAMKYAEKSGKLLIVVEQAEIPKDFVSNIASSDGFLIVEQAKSSSGAVPKLRNSDSKDSPPWLQGMMEKMKNEVKGEIFDCLDKRSTDWKKKCKDVMKRHREANFANEAEDLLCKVCLKTVQEPYYVCLEKKCLAHVCESCVSGHSAEHVMLRLPKNLRSGRRKLAEMAGLVLMSKERTHKKHEKDVKEKKKPKHLKFVNGLPENLSDMTCEIISTKIIFEPNDEICVCWDVKNRGIDWKKDVKLECLAVSDAKLWPIESSLNVAPLKSGEIGTLIARLKLVDVDAMGKFSTYWILTVRGFRFCSLSADICIHSSPNSSVNEVPEAVIEDKNENAQNNLNENEEEVLVDCAAAFSSNYETVDELELFLRSEELKNKSLSSADDDLLSQYSCVSSNSSDHDFEVVAKNAQMLNGEMVIKDEADSYVIATPLNTCDETDDGDIEIIHHSTNLTEFFNQLSSSLSTLASETNANHRHFLDDGPNFSMDEAFGTSADLPVVDPRLNNDFIFDPDTLEMAEPLIKETSENELFFMASEETTPLLVNEQRLDERQHVDADEEERRELEELARSVQNFQIQPPSSVEQTTEIQNVKNVLESVKSDILNQPSTATSARNDPVTTVLTTALRVSSQALTTVSNVLQAVAQHGNNAAANISPDRVHQSQKQWQPSGSNWRPPSTSTDTGSEWQPPKAWVPKSTQTQESWTPPQAWTPNRSLTEVSQVIFAVGVQGAAVERNGSKTEIVKGYGVR